MDELKRFLNSINFEYRDELQNTEIMKVVLKKDTLVYNVYLKSKNVLSYELVTDLFNHAKKGINSKDKCYIELVYDEIRSEDLDMYHNFTFYSQYEKLKARQKEIINFF